MTTWSIACPDRDPELRGRTPMAEPQLQSPSWLYCPSVIGLFWLDISGDEAVRM